MYPIDLAHSLIKNLYTHEDVKKLVTLGKNERSHNHESVNHFRVIGVVEFAGALQTMAIETSILFSVEISALKNIRKRRDFP